MSAIRSTIDLAMPEIKLATRALPSGSIIAAISFKHSINMISFNNGESTVAINNNNPAAPTAFLISEEDAIIIDKPSLM